MEGHQKFLQGGALKSQNFRSKVMKLNWNFFGGGRGCKTKSLPWGEYGYFLELHIITCKTSVRVIKAFYM